MIGKFNEFLTEKNFMVATADTAINYRLSHRPGSGQIVAMASSGKELDKEIESGFSKTEIAKDIEDMLNKQLKKWRQQISVKSDSRYEGAGYAFTIEMDELLKTLNR